MEAENKLNELYGELGVTDQAAALKKIRGMSACLGCNALEPPEDESPATS